MSRVDREVDQKMAEIDNLQDLMEKQQEALDKLRSAQGYSVFVAGAYGLGFTTWDEVKRSNQEFCLAWDEFKEANDALIALVKKLIPY
jgi:hypothetical protein